MTRRLLADPIARSAVAVWLAVAALYLIPQVPADVLRRLGETYSTLPIWPWAIAAALIDLPLVEDRRERRVWRWQAFAFATLLSVEGVRAVVAITGVIDIASEWFYMAFYMGQLASAITATSRRIPPAGAVWRATVACGLAGLALQFVALRFPAAYATGVPSSAAYLLFDGVLVTAWWRARAGQPPRLARAFAGLAVAAGLFFATDVAGMTSMAGWHRVAPGHLTDLFWTLPALAYALSVRTGRLSE
jgi:hypothetical protein